MEKRKFSPKEKLAIVLGALETGKITETYKRHGLPAEETQERCGDGTREWRKRTPEGGHCVDYL